MFRGIDSDGYKHIVATGTIAMRRAIQPITPKNVRTVPLRKS
jgi:hypothetical protein